MSFDPVAYDIQPGTTRWMTKIDSPGCPIAWSYLEIAKTNLYQWVAIFASGERKVIMEL